MQPIGACEKHVCLSCLPVNSSVILNGKIFYATRYFSLLLGALSRTAVCSHENRARCSAPCQAGFARFSGARAAASFLSASVSIHAGRQVCASSGSGERSRCATDEERRWLRRGNAADRCRSTPGLDTTPPSGNCILRITAVSLFL